MCDRLQAVVTGSNNSDYDKEDLGVHAIKLTAEDISRLNAA